MKALPEKAAATAAGLTTYYTGVPCKFGHDSPRYMSTRQCVECQVHRKRSAAGTIPKAKRRRAKVIEARGFDWTEEHQLRTAAMAAGNSRYLSIALCRNEHSPTYRETRKGTCVECKRLGTVRWRAANPEKLRLISLASVHRRMARKKAHGGTFAPADIARRILEQRGRCGYCRQKLDGKFHTDHIQPISKGGNNSVRNIQLLCKPCNQAKSNKDPLVFARQKGLLI